MSLVDGRIWALDKGEDSMKSFEESFEQMIKQTFMRKISMDFLERQADDFTQRLYRYTEGGGELKEWEIARLPDEMSQRAKDAMDRYSKVMQRAGIAVSSAGKKKKEGLSASIKAVTEETADKLVGILHNVRISQGQSIAIQQNMEAHLKGIHSHTLHIKRLEGIQGALIGIQSGFSSKFQEAWKYQLDQSIYAPLVQFVENVVQ